MEKPGKGQKPESERKQQRIASKSQLAIVLSQLKGFENPKVRDEQYLVDSEIAAGVLWEAFLCGNIEKKQVADLGCGTGLLGLGALLLGASTVFFVDRDGDALRAAEFNLSTIKSRFFVPGKAVFRHQDIEQFDEKADTVIQNPPFGTQQMHADKAFLEKAFETAPMVYTFHKTSTAAFVQKTAEKHGFQISRQYDFAFPLKATQPFHRRRIHRIGVSCIRLERRL